MRATKEEVAATGFEPPTSGTRTVRANRTVLRPDYSWIFQIPE